MSHMGLELATMHERNWVEESLVPALLNPAAQNTAKGEGSKAEVGARWTIDVHTALGGGTSNLAADGRPGCCVLATVLRQVVTLCLVV